VEETPKSIREEAAVDRLDPQATPDRTPDQPVVPSARFDPWTYRDDVSVATTGLVGYKVEATDGHIGKVDETSYDVNASYLVVDTGPWIFGKKVMIPAGTVNHVDHDERKVYVDRTKDQIKSAPEFDVDTYANPEYRDKIGGYYGDTYGPTGMPGGMAPPIR
jgi:hypothetical protein